jgi:PAS domain S-box-containing protein
MNEDYESLLSKYLELQLRVTQFSGVEQQLINTRDKLDHELVLYKRFLEFSTKTILASSWSEFNQMVSEFLIDIFEVEYSCFGWITNTDDGAVGLRIEGGEFSDNQKQYVRNFLTNLSKRCAPGKVILLERSDLHQLDPMGLFDSGVFSWHKDEDMEFTIFLMGLNSIENAPLYSKQSDRKKTMFAIFLQNVHGLYQNRLKSQKINDQLEIISKSQIELNKLSLIATKTKNGVIITDKDGRVEWVNAAFTRGTGYELSEMLGKKPGSILQKKGVDEEVSKKLGNAIRSQTAIDVEIQNFTKSGEKYYNNLQITPVFDDEGKVLNFIALQRDITLEVEFKAQLLRMNSKFELITQKANIGIWERDVITGHVEWNSILYDQVGVSPSIKGSELHSIWREMIHPEDAEFVFAKHATLIQSGNDNLELSYRIVRVSDKAERSLNCITIAERDENGVLMRLVGSSVDVTESLMAAQKLRDSEEKYRGIIEHMNLGLAEWGADGKLVYYNNQFEEQCGFDVSTIEVKNGSMIETLSELRKSGVVRHFEVVSEVIAEVSLQQTADKTIHLLLSAAEVKSKGEQGNGWITISHDITSTKSLEKELRAALRAKEKSIKKINEVKVFYENVLNHAPVEMAVFDADMKLLFANERLISSSAIWNDMLGKHPNEIFTEFAELEKELKRLIDFSNLALEGGELVQYEESRNLLGESDDVMLKSVLPYFNSNEQLESVFLSGINISELKKVEQILLRKNDELKKINEELDNFVYSVSHDLRSPLLGIKGLIALIFRSASLDESTIKHLKMAEASVNRLDATIQEILHYSRNARLGLTVDEFDLVQEIEDIFSDLKFVAPETLVMSHDIKGDSFVKTDKSRLNVLLKNLIGNAVKYSKKDIDNQFVQVQIVIEPKLLMLDVRDNGEGIAQENIDKVFEMFFRATKSSVGTGLGLFITKEIVNRFGGTISIDSELKKGTHVHVELPITQQAG